MRYSRHGSPQCSFTGIEITTTDEDIPVIGTVDDVETARGGIFLPFEASYAEYDVLIAAQFLERFKQVSYEDEAEFDDTSNDLVQGWSGGLARTMTGNFLAHMMKTTLLAIDAQTAVFFVIRPDGMYQGAVLYGEKVALRYPGRQWVGGGDQAALEADLEACGGHNNAIRKILDLAGMTTSDPSQFTTIRALSQAVNAPGEPSGMVKNSILKLLPHVSFIERKEGVSVTTLVAAIKLLVSDEAIPDNLYMDKGFFFNNGRFEDVLCQFGDKAPPSDAVIFSGKVCPRISPTIAKLPPPTSRACLFRSQPLLPNGMIFSTMVTSRESSTRKSAMVDSSWDKIKPSSGTSSMMNVAS